jgi:pimeloyl-ACP methyl ester carboxylesterase
MKLPSLVLLPGLDGTGHLFGPLLAALPSNVSTVVVSYPSDTPFGYSALLPLVLGAPPADRPFVLLGESFSGPLAIMAAAAHPSGLVGVVLCASFIRNPHPYVPSVLSSAVRSPVLRLFPRFAQIKALLGGYSSPALRSLTREAVSRVAPAVLACRIREVLRVNVAQQLRACSVPVLYLRAGSDFVVPAWNVKTIRKVNPAVQVLSLQGPHMVLQAVPAAAAEAISHFLTASAS